MYLCLLIKNKYFYYLSLCYYHKSYCPRVSFFLRIMKNSILIGGTQLDSGLKSKNAYFYYLLFWTSKYNFL